MENERWLDANPGRIFINWAKYSLSDFQTKNRMKIFLDHVAT
ncbi:hypothetical protein P872_20015 [Rhodonellum psychrophilum GCM71 = DSM 17998]|uniref:Uncharacterized protein n=1 Tax=Rhodonellum psychrophilum GCM71 = DSM 17998 TaxID=1123057 RepID=U5BUS7_9BACT|nr:hypothetical protein P872_20015 [Rhodonellum psychrophilum GCM71 = DSM 17998]